MQGLGPCAAHEAAGKVFMLSARLPQAATRGHAACVGGRETDGLSLAVTAAGLRIGQPVPRLRRLAGVQRHSLAPVPAVVTGGVTLTVTAHGFGGVRLIIETGPTAYPRFRY